MDLPERIAAVRRFNRFYTRQIGVLNERLLGSELSLAQMRVLWELAHHAPLTASLLEDQLGLDAGYLSRLLRAFREHGWVRAERSERDGRSRELHLTMKGRKVFAPLDRRSEDEVRAWVAALSAARQQRLVAAMQSIEEAFKGAGETARPYVLREPRPGDFGWIVHRHGVLYAQEYGWDTTFEALVAEIVARAARARAPERERCWIAEREGERAGCVFLVKRSARIAQLRLLLVEPAARGLGIGSRLVAEAVEFARHARYQRVMLWTNSILHSARHIYERAGFKRVKEEKHRSFGHDLLGQNWELKL